MAAFVVNGRGNAATAWAGMEPGSCVLSGDVKGCVPLVVRETIPAGHKASLRAIDCGDTVVKYGQRISHAMAALEAARCA